MNGKKFKLFEFNKIIEETKKNLPNDGKPFNIMKYLTVCKISMAVRAALGDSLHPKIRQKYLDGFGK